MRDGTRYKNKLIFFGQQQQREGNFRTVPWESCNKQMAVITSLLAADDEDTISSAFAATLAWMERRVKKETLKTAAEIILYILDI